MSAEKDDDIAGNLAFVRALVSEGARLQGASGQVFMVAGVVYGLDCLIYWAQVAFHLAFAQAIWSALSVVPPVIVLAAIAWVVWRNRHAGEQGAATRALNATFTSIGLANLTMVITFGYAAITEKSMLIWLLYPVVMCTFLGAAWYVAYVVRRKLWLLAVSAGWFIVALATGFLIHDMAAYLLSLGLALIVLMGGSGAWMMRQAKKGG